MWQSRCVTSRYVAAPSFFEKKKKNTIIALAIPHECILALSWSGITYTEQHLVPNIASKHLVPNMGRLETPGARIWHTLKYLVTNMTHFETSSARDGILWKFAVKNVTFWNNCSLYTSDAKCCIFSNISFPKRYIFKHFGDKYGNGQRRKRGGGG